jgi:hypothetical protein
MSSGWGSDPENPNTGPGQPAASQPSEPTAGPQQWDPQAPQYPNQYAPGQPPFPAGPPKRRGPAIGTLIVLGIVAIAVVGFILFRDRLTNDVTSLEVGQCFDKPAVATQEVSDIQRQPCNEPHDAEVIAVLIHPAASGESFPVVSGFDDYIADNCVPVFETYTGRSWETDTELNMGYFQPSLTGWNGGDRGFTCFVSRADGQKLTNTVRSAGSSS